MLSEQIKHIVIGLLVLVGLGILFIPAWLEKSVLITEPLELPEKMNIAEPTPFLTVPEARVKTIEAQIARDRAQSVISVKNSPGIKSPTPVWAVLLAEFPAQEKAQAWVAQLQARGYYAYARVTPAHTTELWVGPEIKKERAQQLVEQLAREVKLQGKVEQYIP